MWMAWGPELTTFYNDSYERDTLQAKHPWALGRPAGEVWAEIWHDIAPRIQSVLDTGVATWDEDLLLFLERSGYPEETYHTFSYSPLDGDDGRIAGMLCVVTETTERVVGERRMATLRDLAAAVATTRTETRGARRGHRAADRRRRRPAVQPHLPDRRRRHRTAGLRHRDRAGIARGSATISADDPAPVWPLSSLRAGEQVTGRRPGQRPPAAAHRRVGRPPDAGGGRADHLGHPGGAGGRRIPRDRAQPAPRATTTATAASSSWSRTRSVPAWPTPPATRPSAGGPRRWPSWTGPRPTSSATSATSSARR